MRESGKSVYNSLFNMHPLNLGYVNRLSPYKVWTENGRDFYIETDYGNLFKVGFMDDYSIWDTGAYQFTINNEHNLPSPNDNKLKLTLFRLIEAFFNANPDILLYICETGDNKQRLRNRLFVRWFNSYGQHQNYVLKTVEVMDGDMANFAALIVQKSNPKLKDILSEFDETISLLQK